MTTYATVEDVQARMSRQMTTDEEAVCEKMLEDAAVIIDAYNPCAKEVNKFLVSCRMVVRAIGDGGDIGVPMGATLGDGTSIGIPLGATQGSMSALGYSQSWTLGSGAAGELYLGKIEKKLLGASDRIGSYSPTQELAPEEGII